MAGFLWFFILIANFLFINFKIFFLKYIHYPINIKKPSLSHFGSSMAPYSFKHYSYWNSISPQFMPIKLLVSYCKETWNISPLPLKVKMDPSKINMGINRNNSSCIITEYDYSIICQVNHSLMISAKFIEFGTPVFHILSLPPPYYLIYIYSIHILILQF